MPRSAYLFAVFGDCHAQGVLAAGLCSTHHGQNLPEGQCSRVHKQQEPHDSGDPMGDGASFVKHNSLYLQEQLHVRT